MLLILLLRYPDNFQEIIDLGTGDPRFAETTALHGAVISRPRPPRSYERHWPRKAWPAAEHEPTRTSTAVGTPTPRPGLQRIVPQRSLQIANTTLADCRLAKSVLPSGLKQAPAHSLPSCPG